MTNEQANFIMHAGKKGMKWGVRSANPKYGERSVYDRNILAARARYEKERPGKKAAIKTARSEFRKDRTEANYQKLITAKGKLRVLDAATSARNIETGREWAISTTAILGTTTLAAIGIPALLKAGLKG